MPRKRLKDGRRITGYNVYYAPDGCGETFLGEASTMRQARQLASRGGGLPQYMYETARAAGHCGGISAPDKSREVDDSAIWLAVGDGFTCAVPVAE